MAGSVFWSIIFFLMLITLGLDSTFGGLEAMITALCDEYPKVLGRHRETFVGVLLLAIYICALPTTTYVSVRFQFCQAPKATRSREVQSPGSFVSGWGVSGKHAERVRPCPFHPVRRFRGIRWSVLDLRN